MSAATSTFFSHYPLGVLCYVEISAYGKIGKHFVSPDYHFIVAIIKLSGSN